MPTFNEYLTSNVEIAYPFKDNATGLALSNQTPVHGATPLLPRDFFIDMVVLTPQPEGAVHLKSIERNGDDFTFIFTDTAGTVLVNNVKNYATFPVERDMITFETAAVDSNDTVRIRAIVGEAFGDYLGTMPDLSTNDYTDLLPVNDGAVEHRPARVSAIRINDATYGQVDINEVARLYEGYNCDISTAANILSEPGTDASQITITLGPGLGKGTYNPCGDEEPIEYLARVNSIRPDDDGNFFISPTECYNVITDPDNSRIILENICIPCCECDDYANMVKAIKNQLQYLRDTQKTLDGTIRDFNDQVEEFNNTTSLTKELELVVDGMAGFPHFEAVSGSTHCTITIGLKNWGEAVTGATLGLDLTPQQPGAVFQMITGWVLQSNTSVQLDQTHLAQLLAGTYVLPDMNEASMTKVVLSAKVQYPYHAVGTALVTYTNDTEIKEATGTWYGIAS